jgi:hypothetical protein
MKFARLNEKDCPTAANCACIGGDATKESAGLTVTETDLDLLESLTDVAVTVTVSEALTLPGATNLFWVPLALFVWAIAPQAFTPAVQITVQVTP